MSIHGKNIIGYTLVATSKQVHRAYDPVTTNPLDGAFVSATLDELDHAVKMAYLAFKPYRRFSQEQRADFLDRIAEEILNLGDELILRAISETALPEGRIIGERGRTVGQLQAFASLLREGSWLEATIDLAQPDRQPVPKPDIRRMLVPMGPVVVFAASNFPLAFSVAGGDTASALAAGNPVIVKAHSGHLGTSELIAGAVVTAARHSNMPDGVFSLLHGSGSSIGQSLVKHPLVRAVGFTGSTTAGRLLFDLANQRPDPIPVFAEMGSINPVLITPRAIAARGSQIATLYAGSITLGVGQFCTNPGLMIGLAGNELDRFIAELAKEISAIAPETMLNKNVYSGFNDSYQEVMNEPGIQAEGKSQIKAQAERQQASPTVASISGKTFLENSRFAREVFGPFSLVVKCSNKQELHSVLNKLEGQLTTTVMAEAEDFEEFSDAIDLMNQKSGRIINNGVPTGVEVCAAMQHGGPYPAATDCRFTSVGTAAIKRFVRPVAFQSWPDSALPDELKNSNPLKIWRLVDNNWTKDPVLTRD